MPFSILWDGHGLIKRLDGFITTRELRASTDAVVAHPEFDRAEFLINDFTHVAGYLCLDESTTEHIAVMRLGAYEINPNLRVLYVGTDPLIQILVDKLSSPPYAVSWETRVFPTVGDAMGWLDDNPMVQSARLWKSRYPI